MLIFSRKVQWVLILAAECFAKLLFLFIALQLRFFYVILTMACSPLEIDRDLNFLFDSCASEGSDEADINELAAICVERYAPGRTELKLIILQKFQTSEENHLISRSEFITKVKAWISEITSVDENEWPSHSSSSDFSCSSIEHSLYTSTPLHSRPKLNHALIKEAFYDKLNSNTSDTNEGCSTIYDLRQELSKEREVLKDKTNILESCLAQSEQRIQNMKEKNVSLEMRLTRSEQRNNSLEQEIKRLTNDLHQRTQSFGSENRRLNNALTELQEKLKHYSDECYTLNLENQKLKSELEKCQCQELLPKNNELQLELDLTNKSYLAELRSKEAQINALKNELKLIKDLDKTNRAEMDSLRIDNTSLLLNQEELIVTIGELREKKQELQEKLDEATALESLRFGSFNSLDSGSIELNEQRESGISVRSIFQEGLNFGSLERIFDESNIKRCETNNTICQTEETDHITYRVKTNNLSVQTDEIHIRYETDDRICQTEETDLITYRIETNNRFVQTDEASLRYETLDRICQTEETHLITYRIESNNRFVQTDEAFLRYETDDRICQTEETHFISYGIETINRFVQTNEAFLRYETDDRICQTEETPLITYRESNLTSSPNRRRLSPLPRRPFFNVCNSLLNQIWFLLTIFFILIFLLSYKWPFEIKRSKNGVPS